MLSHRAHIIIFLLVIMKLICCKRIFIADGLILLTVKPVMFYIGGYIIVLQPLIIFFTSITCIGNTIIRQGAKLFFVLFEMSDQRIGICGVLMDRVGCDVLGIGR